MTQISSNHKKLIDKLKVSTISKSADPKPVRSDQPVGPAEYYRDRALDHLSDLLRIEYPNPALIEVRNVMELAFTWNLRDSMISWNILQNKDITTNDIIIMSEEIINVWLNKNTGQNALPELSASQKNKLKQAVILSVIDELDLLNSLATKAKEIDYALVKSRYS